MVLLDQIKYELGQYKEPMEDLGRALAREEKDARIAEIEGLMNQPGFWEDSKTSASLMKEMKSLKGDIEPPLRI